MEKTGNNINGGGTPGSLPGTAEQGQGSTTQVGGAVTPAQLQLVPQQHRTFEELQDQRTARLKAIVAVIGFGLIAVNGDNPPLLAATGCLAVVCLFNYYFKQNA